MIERCSQLQAIVVGHVRIAGRVTVADPAVERSSHHEVQRTICDALELGVYRRPT